MDLGAVMKNWWDNSSYKELDRIYWKHPRTGSSLWGVVQVPVFSVIT